ncbi:MAG: hypothetical protein AAB663_01800 [Patescibacteria group bacterium]
MKQFIAKIFKRNAPTAVQQAARPVSREELQQAATAFVHQYGDVLKKLSKE